MGWGNFGAAPNPPAAGSNVSVKAITAASSGAG